MERLFLRAADAFFASCFSYSMSIFKKQLFLYLTIKRQKKQVPANVLTGTLLKIYPNYLNTVPLLLLIFYSEFKSKISPVRPVESTQYSPPPLTRSAQRVK